MNRIRPILFNTEMVRAILEGRKTVTRRVIKQEKCLGVLQSPSRKIHPEIPDEYYIKRLVKPPYEPGDILYVRETWCNANKDAAEPDYYYFADTYICEDYRAKEWKWSPSIHMPKAAARIWLRVTDVRVERLQDITEEQAKAEGAVRCHEVIRHGSPLPVIYEDEWGYYALGFKAIWDSTIQPKDKDIYSWSANPWVWVIEFERCEKPEEG